ncbi:MAG: tRNA uridine-5-carboxymethylaminomethyl(34) synthesis GTPase MnmE [Pseudomonadota bacterium]
MVTTIFAKSSGAGRSAIAVWRISGPLAGDVLETLSGHRPTPRHASHRRIHDAVGETIDDGIVLWFPGPKSATGENLAEVHLHGSQAVSSRFVEVLTGLGLTPAEPGEFTLRALRNGRMGLLEAEGLGDLLDAETEQQRKQAQAGYDGSARALVDEWRDGLIEALAVLEAAVDFPDEEDIPASIADLAVPALQQVRSSLQDELMRSAQGKRLREGLTLAIIGPPNVGKSTILNRLLGEERAIVSDIPGTTRDVVSARLDLAGRLVEILDTAGLRMQTVDPIEKLGMERSRAVAEKADIIIDVSSPEDRRTDDVSDPRILAIMNKSDLSGDGCAHRLSVSAQTGAGWSAFLEALTGRVESAASPALFTHDRQLALLRVGQAGLDRALSDPSTDPELLSEDVREVINVLDQITGKITVEDVLGAIFSRFCVGK